MEICKHHSIHTEMHIQSENFSREIHSINFKNVTRIIVPFSSVRENTGLAVILKDIPSKVGLDFTKDDILNLDFSVLQSLLINLGKCDKFVVMNAGIESNTLSLNTLIKFNTMHPFYIKNIQLDGGITKDNINFYAQAGYTQFVIGSSIFSGDVAKNYTSLIANLR